MIRDPRVLLYNLLDSPDSYESGVAELLQQLISKTRTLESLTKSEQELLDRAVIDFTAPKRTKPEVESEKLAAKRERTLVEQKLEEEEEESEDEADGLHVLPSDTPTFWWRK